MKFLESIDDIPSEFLPSEPLTLDPILLSLEKEHLPSFQRSSVPSEQWIQKRKDWWRQEENRESAFLSKLNNAKEGVERVLELDRTISLPHTHPHTYDDKYSLADFIGIGTIASVLKFFQKLGMEIYSPVFTQMKQQVQTKSVTLRFNSREDCKLLKKETVEREISRSTSTWSFTTRRVTKEVTIYTYELEAHISLSVFLGNNPDQAIVLQEDHMTCKRVLEDTDVPPHKLTKNEPIDLNVTWLFQHLDDDNKVFFCVDRNAEDCFTPTQNEEIRSASDFINRYKKFCKGVNDYFCTTLLPLDPSPHRYPDLEIFVPILPIFEEGQEWRKEKEKEMEKAIEEEKKEVEEKKEEKPEEVDDGKGKQKLTKGESKGKIKDMKDKKKAKVKSLLKKKKGTIGKGKKKRGEVEVREDKQERMDSIRKVMGNLLVFYSSDSTEDQSNALKESVSLFHSFKEEPQERISLVPFHLLPQLLSEQSRTIKERIKDIDFQMKEEGTFYTPIAMKIVCLVNHGVKLSEAFTESVHFIERILYKQFVAAIGKEVNFVDFDEYMRFHVRKVYEKNYIPRVFSWPVRVEGRVPEGVIQIQQEFSDHRPILTASHAFKAKNSMNVVLNAASTAAMWGERHVHLWTTYQFDSQEVPLSLTARAREFSNFILILGTIPTKNVFDPSHAIILQDKDEVILPLILETIPTAKEFKAKVNSLSPEQQAFSKAYRALQLASTLFGIMVLPIEPQLEKLLNLPKNSLAKELELQKDVLSYMTEYDIPSSMLCCDPLKEIGAEEKVSEVRANYTAVKHMLFPPPPPPPSSKRIVPSPPALNESNDLLAQIKGGTKLRKADIPTKNSVSSNSPSGAFDGLLMALSSRRACVPEDDESDFSDDDSWGCGGGGGGGYGGYGGSLEGQLMAKECDEEELFECAKGDEQSFAVEDCFSAAPVPILEEACFSSNNDLCLDIVADSCSLSSIPVGSASIAPPAPTPVATVTRTTTTTTQTAPTPVANKKPEVKKEEVKKEEVKKEEVKKEEGDQEGERDVEGEGIGGGEEGSEVDFVALPKKLEGEYERLGLDGCVRPTIIKPGENWTRTRQKTLLSQAEEGNLSNDNLVEEKKKSYDLLDALSRSGVLSFDNVTLHILIGSTVQFEKCLIDSVVQENIDVIDMAERANFVATSLVNNGESFETFLN